MWLCVLRVQPQLTYHCICHHACGCGCRKGHDRWSLRWQRKQIWLSESGHTKMSGSQSTLSDPYFIHSVISSFHDIWTKILRKKEKSINDRSKPKSHYTSTSAVTKSLVSESLGAVRWYQSLVQTCKSYIIFNFMFNIQQLDLTYISRLWLIVTHPVSQPAT